MSKPLLSICAKVADKATSVTICWRLPGYVMILHDISRISPPGEGGGGIRRPFCRADAELHGKPSHMSTAGCPLKQPLGRPEDPPMLRLRWYHLKKLSCWSAVCIAFCNLWRHMKHSHAAMMSLPALALELLKISLLEILLDCFQD